MPTVPGGIAPAAHPAAHPAVADVAAGPNGTFMMTCDFNHDGQGPVFGPQRDTLDEAWDDVRAHLADQPSPA